MFTTPECKVMSNRRLWEGAEVTQTAQDTFDSCAARQLKATFGTDLVCAAVQQVKTMN